MTFLRPGGEGGGEGEGEGEGEGAEDWFSLLVLHQNRSARERGRGREGRREREE